jgi:uncharacterized Ntn-hydrolase superfamily protein
MRFGGFWTLACVVVGVVGVVPASATWSICIADSETKEIAVGTVTCLTSYDLLAIVPVVVVEKGAAACQASGDFDGIRRPILFDQLVLGTPPEEILVLLSGISGHQSRQYGIADTQGRTATFTGSQAFQWAGGVTGSQGTMVYAIQGNILAGSCVVPAIEQAILNTPGDVPEKLMAGMEAAAQTGGDGRCSCSQSYPTSCGCPPPSFFKAGHIGGMVVARVGDTDDPVCNSGGCADGDYLMRLNVSFQPPNGLDPVLQLRQQFDYWRSLHVGRPDAIHSAAGFAPQAIPPNGVTKTQLMIGLQDWQDLPTTATILNVSVVHAPGSAGLSTIGAITPLGQGQYAVEMTAGTSTGMDRLRVTVHDGTRPVTLMPDAVLVYYPLGDLTRDGLVDYGDLERLAACLTGPAVPNQGCNPNDYVLCDLDGDGDVDVHDVAGVQAAVGGS